ncbi:NAD-dependent epimerase/dehydratase family protein [Verticiella sediminum]|uniref:NAD-dependent epimerase/dehydratase family protein n=1 Tax=Verticiella sediminum TaxID=1247510 RepID=A0A556A7J5_9BURK|nr:GDP-mannose 4,6-dehydratase [Verticiella sediminum]TSH88866.1 NAD-dependent epimerase/dehydratase family protein [Verticiella sediminum]
MNLHPPPRRLLVTGHRGFVGQALLDWLPRSRWQDRAVLLTPGSDFDLCDAGAVRRLVRDARPDAVLHLAAQSFVPAAFADPAGTFAVNVEGTLHLLQALRQEAPGARLLYVSSADVYGAVEPEAMPVDETRLPEPRNPYAVSKAAAEMLCRQWHFTEGTDVVLARPFNHTGPGQDARFAVSGFARSVARIALGLEAPRLVTGNLQVTRDFSDVRDVLDAYLRLIHDGQPGAIYNVCSGIEQRLADVLAALLRLAGVSAEQVTDPARLRPNEQLRMVGSSLRLRKDTGWQPAHDFDETLATLLAWWRHKELNP